MAQALDPSDIVTYRELILTNSIHLDTITQLLIEKGIISYGEKTSIKSSIGFTSRLLHKHENRPLVKALLPRFLSTGEIQTD